jgi:ribosomal protein S11
MSRLKKFNFVKRIFYLTLKRVKRNMFVNISNLSGAVLKKISAGMFFKRTVRKTFFATDVTLKKAFVLFKQTKSLQNAIVFMNIYGNVHKKGYKKNIKTLLHSRGFSLASLNILDMRAHNGVRKPKRRRK